MEGKSSRQDSSSLRERILAASGEKRAGLVLKGARVVNVFTGELEEADVAIEAGYIAGVGSYEGETEVDLSGKIICPGFIDGHIHLESSMVRPAEFERAVLPHGTTAVITDPHEIANVAGTEGIDYMLYETRRSDAGCVFYASILRTGSRFRGVRGCAPCRGSKSLL